MQHPEVFSMKILIVALLFLAQADGPKYKGQTREPHPLAPSLPKLSDQEYKEMVAVIDRFIAQDTGKLQGQEAKNAVEDFNALGPAAFFALIEGLNKAANMEDSCPALFIGKKLRTILAASKDIALLDFAKENIGAGVTAKRHQGLLTDLRFGVTTRKAQLTRGQVAGNKQAPPAGSKEKAVRDMTVAELATAVGRSSADEKKKYLLELAIRKGEEPVLVLGLIADKDETQAKTLAQTLLLESLGRYGTDELKVWLKKGSRAIRAAAARTIGDKGYKLIDALIVALADSEESVRQAAREALVKLTGNSVDHGPAVAAEPAERTRSQERWRDYWKNR
jgi:hypothetical protein